MRVVIAGGHGKIALRLTRRLRARGESDFGLIRGESDFGLIRDPRDVVEVLAAPVGPPG